MVDLHATKPAGEKTGQGFSIRGLSLILTTVLLALGLIQVWISQTISPVVVLMVCASIVMAFFIDRQVSLPLKNLRNAVQQMGAGVLDQQVEVRGAAELAAFGRDLNNACTQLRLSRTGTEQRARQQTQKLEERSRQLQIAAEVARDVTTTRASLGELLNKSVNLIRDRFGFYHSGVFLIDEQGEYAILQAATGEAGAEMLKRDHKLKVGAEGIVGYVSAAGKSRISLDVGADAVHFKNPLLPNTRSEIALPLKVGQTTIGVLDVQSIEVNAFREEDLGILQLIADQLAIAIDHTRLFQVTQDSLYQMEQAYGQYSREAWERLGQARTIHGYHYDQKGMHSVEGTEVEKASPDGSFPLKVHGQAIGDLEVWTEDPDGLSDFEKNTLKVIAERVSQVMDSARLYEETRVRAAREQTLSELTAQFTQSLRFDALLQSAVQELGRLPKVAEASIHIGLPDDRSQPREQDEHDCP